LRINSVGQLPSVELKSISSIGLRKVRIAVAAELMRFCLRLNARVGAFGGQSCMFGSARKTAVTRTFVGAFVRGATHLARTTKAHFEVAANKQGKIGAPSGANRRSKPRLGGPKSGVFIVRLRLRAIASELTRNCSMVVSVAKERWRYGPFGRVSQDMVISIQ
jgi:hypothetical protein